MAWDAALRGFDVVLVDRADLAEGTSGRFHGLLHSGGRYAVKDPHAAEECVAENAILRQVAADCIEDTGGFFVTTPFDDPAYADRFAQGCRDTGVPCEEIDPAQALREEPRLNPEISRAFRVPDASIDVWKTVWAMARGAQQRGARVLPYHGVDRRAPRRRRGHGRARARRAHGRGDRRRGARHGQRGGCVGRAHRRAWPGIEGVRILPGRGIMIAMNHRLVNTVINRCQMPTDGDILVPIRTVSVIGTTDEHTDDADDHTVHRERGRRDARRRREARAGLQARRGRCACGPGVRPLFEDAKASDTDTRDVTRAHALLDHAERDGVARFVTITGGKLTTYRLMAEETVDAVCRQLGEQRACTSATVPLPGSESGEHYKIGERLARKEDQLADEQLICECEMVPRSRLEEAMRRRETHNLDDIRRMLRLGMGPCQGGLLHLPRDRRSCTASTG